VRDAIRTLLKRLVDSSNGSIANRALKLLPLVQVFAAQLTRDVSSNVDLQIVVGSLRSNVGERRKDHVRSNLGS
jgi:hypothetical protein